MDEYFGTAPTQRWWDPSRMEPPRWMMTESDSDNWNKTLDIFFSTGGWRIVVGSSSDMWWPVHYTVTRSGDQTKLVRVTEIFPSLAPKPRLPDYIFVLSSSLTPTGSGRWSTLTEPGCAWAFFLLKGSSSFPLLSKGSEKVIWLLGFSVFSLYRYRIFTLQCI